MAESSDATSSVMSLDVLGLINDARMTYGLRHEDYNRYRDYCTNRVHRLRQILKLTQSNSKKNNSTKPLPESFSDVRYLQLFIYDTERSWAYAMELKLESNNSMETRHRHHLVKRLKRASQHAESLYQLCEKQQVDIRTQLDVKAYASLMKGYLYFEKQNWQDALNQFVEARTIYESFAKYGNNAEAEALCFSAIDEIDPNIRFCSYKLQPGASQDIESIVGNLKSNSAEMQKLESQLSSEDLVKNQSQSVQAISWRQKEITIKHQTVSEAVLKAQEMTKNAAGKEGDVAAAFNAILAAWADAEKKAKKALKDDKEATAKVSSSKSALATQNLETLFTFVEYNLYAASIERNLRLAKKIEESNGKVQQVIKLYDDSLKDLEYLADLPKMREDMSLEGELHSVALYYKAYRCHLVALAYIDMSKIPESLALYQRAQAYLVQTKQTIQQIRGFSNDSLLIVSNENISQLEQAIHSGTWKARAAWYLENGDDTVTDKMESLTLNASSETALIDQLDSYPSALSQGTLHLVDFPPKFQPVACKPFYFDLAANHIKYPDALAERTEKASGGIWKLFGFGK